MRRTGKLFALRPAAMGWVKGVDWLDYTENVRATFLKATVDASQLFLLSAFACHVDSGTFVYLRHNAFYVLLFATAATAAAVVAIFIVFSVHFSLFVDLFVVLQFIVRHAPVGPVHLDSCIRIYCFALCSATITASGLPAPRACLFFVLSSCDTKRTSVSPTGRGGCMSLRLLRAADPEDLPRPAGRRW